MVRSNGKSMAAPLLRLGGLVLLMATLGVGPVGAGVGIAPGGAIIFCSSESKAGATTDTKTATAPGLGDWSVTLNSHADDAAHGAYASGQKTMLTGFDADNFHVSSNGTGSATGGATVAGGSLLAVFFAVDTVQIFNASSYMIPGSYASNRLHSFVANMNNGETQIIPLVAGAGYTTVSGRLPPGVYMLYMDNSFGPETDDGDETTFSTGIGFITCANPLINQQPTNQSSYIHTTTRFRVGTSVPAPGVASGEVVRASSALTFQWRKGLQNLSDGGRISGVHTNELVITDTAVPDSGLYDCVVTQDAVVEPSSLVHLTVWASTDVPAIGGPSALAMELPSPSPFTDRTQVRFTLPRAGDASLDVLDVNGRRVRQLMARGPMAAGTHTATWDGRDARGARSAAGVYFLRLASGSEQVVRRVVNLGAQH